MQFVEIFEGYAYDNLMFIVDRDMLTKLNEFYGVGTLPDFAEKTLGRVFRFNYPAFALDPGRGASVESENYLENELRLLPNLCVSDPDPIEVTRKLVKYARAFRSIVRGATRADWLRDISSPQVMPWLLNIAWEFGEPAKNPNRTNTWICDVAFELTFKFNER